MRTIAGFDVLTLANNHSVDFGRGALLDTLASCRAAGIAADRRRRERSRRRAARRCVDGGRAADRLPRLLGREPARLRRRQLDGPGTARAELSSIDADVRAARRRADVVVCFFHWGTELHAAPEARQQQFAAACLAAGAQVVLGAHPHVLGSVIRPAPRTLVAWTLGNFVFPSSGLHRRARRSCRCALDARGVRGFRLLPVTDRRLSAAPPPPPPLSRTYPQVAHSAVEMLIIQNPQSADFSCRGPLARAPGPCRFTSAPSAQRE